MKRALVAFLILVTAAPASSAPFRWPWDYPVHHYRYHHKHKRVVIASPIISEREKDDPACTKIMEGVKTLCPYGSYQCDNLTIETNKLKLHEANRVKNCIAAAKVP